MNKQPAAVPQPPERKVDGDTVPQADQQHGADLRDEQNAPDRQPGAAQRARERIEGVGAEPLGERDVPVVPELGEI